MSYPLSQSQLSIFLACQGLKPEEGNYQLSFLYKLPDVVDVQRLASAMQAVVQARPYLLSRLVLEEGMPRMEEHTNDFWQPLVRDVDTIDSVRPTFCRAMDLLSEPLFRMEIYRTPEANYAYVDFHHILLDGGSCNVFFDLLDMAYSNKPLPAESVSAQDIALQEEAARKGPEYAAAQQWFAETFGEATELDSLLLPDVYDATPQPYRSLSIPLPVDGADVKALLEHYGCRRSVLMTAAFGATLAAWTAETRSCFSTIWNGRSRDEERDTLTMSVHTQPVCLQADPSLSVTDYLKATAEQLDGLRSHACFSFTDCVHELGLAPAVDFAYQGHLLSTHLSMSLEGRLIPPEDLRTHPPGTGLAFELFSQDDERLVFHCWHRPDQHSESLVRSFAESFAACLSSMAHAGTLAELCYTTKAQRAQLTSFEPELPTFDTSKTVVDLFRENAATQPEHIAGVYGDSRLTYAEVDRLSDNLAARIQQLVKPGSVVSIILNRGMHMMITPAAAVKAGCAYQPLDPSYPPERLSFMVKDAHASLLIADPGLEQLVKDYEGPVLPTTDIAGLPDAKPEGAPSPEDLFILLYTSGTTGTPKGCMLAHRNLATHVRNNARNLGIGPDAVTTAYASFGFDAFMGDLWYALCAGATLHIIPEEIRLDLVALKDYYEQNGITHAFMTTQVATQFALNFPQCKGLQVLITGGEKMASIPLPDYRYYNGYGPTECTCYVISKHVKKQEPNIPIGRPLPGVHAYIVAKNGQLLPTGAAGELLLSGLQVGMGYLNLPDKTAAAFIANPFEPDPAYARVYRTGDIVRWREDGDIEFVGRKDSQVKVRGFRIELKEVETVILEYPGITDATVQAFDEEVAGGGKYLTAYVVSEQPVETDKLNAFILERKPPYMVPAVTMQIDKIPLNLNQKVDRKALPKPQAQPQKNKTADAPLNILEQEIADLIRDTVHIEGCALTEPLIYYGLTSLSALRLATEIYKKYGVQMNMDTFVKTATLQSIENEVLRAMIHGQGVPEARVEDRTDTPQPLTFQQAGVYFDCMKAPQETLYNIPMMWTLPAGIEAEKVAAAAKQVLRCHPYLNTHFEMKDGQAVQVPVAADPHVECITVNQYELETYKRNFKQPFNLAEGPLYQVSVVRCGDGLYLFTDFHHLVFDGRSYDIFISQLTRILDGKDLAPESYSYFDYARDQQEYKQSEAYAAARDFFAEQMNGCEGASGVLSDLPGDGPGKEAQLTKKVDCNIAQRCLDLGISPASYYLAAAFLTVGAFCGSRKVYLCTISNGRSDMRTADTLGMFVNTLALAGDIGHGSVDEFLKDTDQRFADTLRHEYYPFAQIASDYDFQPQVMLAYQVGVLQQYQIGGVDLTGTTLEIGTPKFPLSIFIEGTEDNESITLAYDATRYTEALMQCFADAMETVVRGLLTDAPLDALPLADGERMEELNGFNHYTLPVDTTQTIVSLFRAQASATPEAPAVAFEETVLTYKELDQLTDRIAADIARRGLGREDVVSILIGRSELMAVTALGILKAGCAYQPLDPSYPAERLNFMVQDASAKLLIAEPELRGLLTDYTGDVLLTGELASLGEGPVPEGPEPDSLFILLYTSGSTGVPKGCMLEHRNLVNFCAWYHRYYDLHAGGRVAAYASFGFDACMMDLYPALTCGACVHIIPEDTRHDMAALSAFITDNRITHSFMTTQVGVMFARNFPGNPALKHLSVGGEKLVSLDPPSYGFHNGYGPTECTIFTTIFDVKEKEPNIPIGHPLDNVHLYVVDDAGRRLPAGAAGELWVSGPQVGRGYLNRPDKTAETFIANPFADTPPYDRVYRTGDIVRYRPDGNIEFVGRNDGQVKIRGFRVETKEVEAVIREFPGVKDVTVQAFDAPSGGKFIAAYVVAEGTLDTQALSSFILERKPPYMVPASFNTIDKIPLNVNQKVDRKALPAPVMAASTTYVEPATDTERTLCEAFAKVLDLEKVGALDNFFDLGGTSLMVTNLLVEAEKCSLKFSYGEVFVFPTPRALAAHLTGETADNAAPDETDVSSYDYTAIDRVLAGNTLEGLDGEPLPIGSRILLTGATGFLGIHVLRELLEQTPEETTVWCLLRGKGSITAERRLAEMLVYYFEKKYRALIGSRIQVIEGDITNPAVFDKLVEDEWRFDMVINCAANVKHFSKGNDIEEINYGGVKNLVAFCEKVSARFIQVSTESVAGMSTGETPMTFTEQQLWAGQNTDNQYVHSKFLAERLVLEHIAAGTLHGKIMRAGNLSPRAEDGEFQANFNANTSMGRIKAYRMLGACPYDLLDAKMEFSPIDQTARALVLLSRTPDALCVFHVSNDHLLPMDDILSRIRLDDGKPLAYVENEEFVRRMDEAKSDPEKARILSSILAYTTTPGGTRMVINVASTSFTMQVLHRLGFRWDETSRDYVDMIFEMLAALRYFDL